MRNAEKDAVDSEGEGLWWERDETVFFTLGPRHSFPRDAFVSGDGGERKITYANNCCANWPVDGNRQLQGGFLPVSLASRHYLMLK